MMQFFAITIFLALANISFVDLSTEPQAPPPPIENTAPHIITIESVNSK